jgi:hypothetical protein
MIVYGGYAFDDIWSLSLSGPPQWTQLSPFGPSPPGRNYHSALLTPNCDRMIVFGGFNACDYTFNETWLLSFGPAVSGVWKPEGPLVASLEGPRPNPFSGITSIGYQLDRDQRVTIDVLDVSGRFVSRILDATQLAGRHRAVWNGTDRHDHPVGPGVYFFRLETGGRILTRKVVRAR